MHLLEPQVHFHVLEQRSCLPQNFLTSAAVARLREQPTQAQIATGDQRAHAQLFGDPDRASVLAVSLFSLIGTQMNRNLTEQPVRPRFVPALLVGASKLQSMLG